MRNDSIHAAINATYREIGHLYDVFSEATKDGVIDRAERVSLEEIGATLHKRTETLLALMFAVYCPRKGALVTQDVRLTR
ncbi:hypothetical protein [Massilia eburnea]|uniref:hypothetical protein n=1 Tax=Massilia eburnea TaxID=1776165 RepID=UPI003D6B7429